MRHNHSLGILALISLVGFAGLPSVAFAIPVAGSSSGLFSNPTCVSPPNTCTVVGGTLFRYGDSPAGFSSLSVAGNAAIAGNTNFSPSVGTLTWTNNIDISAAAGNAFGIDLTLTLALTAPPGGGSVGGPIGIVESLTPFIDLGFIQIPTGLDPDTLTLPDLSAAVITLLHSAGTLTINNFQYSGDANSGLSGLIWTVGEGNTRSINISADFSNVPEPGTLGLIGVGLLGLSAMRRRRRSA